MLICPNEFLCFSTTKHWEFQIFLIAMSYKSTSDCFISSLMLLTRLSHKKQNIKFYSDNNLLQNNLPTFILHFRVLLNLISFGHTLVIMANNYHSYVACISQLHNSFYSETVSWSMQEFWLCSMNIYFLHDSQPLNNKVSLDAGPYN